jgi:hypothetical protein
MLLQQRPEGSGGLATEHILLQQALYVEVVKIITEGASNFLELLLTSSKVRSFCPALEQIAVTDLTGPSCIFSKTLITEYLKHS